MLNIHRRVEDSQCDPSKAHKLQTHTAKEQFYKGGKIKGQTGMWTTGKQRE